MKVPKNLNNHDFGFVGECIYCGSKENLSDEHIVPYGLGGRSILRRASCDKCANITSQIEMDVLRIQFGYYRTSINSPTRRKKERLQTIPLVVEILDGKEEKIQLEASKSPEFLITIEYDEPGIYTGRKDKGMRVTASRLLANKDKFDKFVSDYNIKSLKVSSTFNNSYARMLAKIAYCYAVGNYSLKNIERCFVLPHIMTETEGLGMFVGCPKENIITSAGTGHTCKLDINPDGVIRARLKLFDYWDTPEYEVIVGSLKESAIKQFI